jgi:hypothetical protein
MKRRHAGQKTRAEPPQEEGVHFSVEDKDDHQK